jgi:anti-anti-sigma regulatory factor
MMISVVGSHVVVYLEGRLDLADLAQINDDLLQVPSIRSVDIDLSGVTEIDAAGVQFLAIMEEEALVAGKTCRFVGSSTPNSAIREGVKFPGQDAATESPPDTCGSL